MSDTTKEAAARMRKELKAAGYNSRKVSVRTDYYSMGSSIHVTVRARGVDGATVKAIANAGERIDRCEITGEILSGGNLFVHFDYCGKLLKEIEADISAEVEAGFAAMYATPGEKVTICGLEFYIPASGDRLSDICHWENDSSPRNIWRDVHALSSFVARRVAQRAGGTDATPVAPVVLKLVPLAPVVDTQVDYITALGG